MLEKLVKKKEIKQILVTSNTLSSTRIIQNFKSHKIVHQFFPIDTNFHTKKFINHWKPSLAVFIDSEIWPNMIINLKKKNIPIGLINARITKKTFERWKLLPNLSKKIFNKFDLCLSASKESQTYCKKLGIKNINFYGNLKFSQSENEKNSINANLKRFIKSRKVWCASSTHHNEENLCGEAHKQLKKKYKNLLTIIIPRHIERANRIEKELKNLDLKTHVHKSNKRIDNKTDIYLVNTYGMTKSFFNICNNIFLGGSLVNHGGQNPLEATRYGCNVIHGPHISNFREIYNFLKKNKLSYKISNKNEMTSILKKLFSKKSKSKKIEKRLYLIGQKVLQKTFNEIDLLIKK